jgi:hypothetical protein
MELRIQIVAIVATTLLLVGVLELVRRRALLERYALLWLLSSLVLLALAAWKDLLSEVAQAVGIFYPPSALFVIAFGFILVLLLHFSVAVSRLADQSKVLAQRVALLERRLADADGERNPELAPPEAEDEQRVLERGLAASGPRRSAR